MVGDETGVSVSVTLSVVVVIVVAVNGVECSILLINAVECVFSQRSQCRS